jgi:NAD(P)-dependent dehydrogenase (short-subunit alcohol dehydrogenase family)
VQRIAVVTGGSSGIGAAIARRLAERDWHCVLLARGEERLRQVAGEIGAEWEVCDVADREAVEGVAAAVTGRHPAIELLVCSAGIPGRTAFLSADPKRIEQVVHVNYLGTVWTVRAFLPALEAAAPSAVVNIASTAGTVTFPPSGPYSASKHAQVSLGRALAADLRGHGIRVHNVLPGFVETPGFPQGDVRKIPVVGRLVVGPDRVARHVVRLVERGHATETHVPRWYRIGTISQGLFPGIMRAVVGRFAHGKERA